MSKEREKERVFMSSLIISRVEQQQQQEGSFFGSRCDFWDENYSKVCLAELIIQIVLLSFRMQGEVCFVQGGEVERRAKIK